MNDLEDHIAGLAQLITPAQRARYRTLLASRHGREKIRTIDLRNRGELPFDERYVTIVTDAPLDRLARRIEKLNDASDVCLWTENDAPSIVSLHHVFEEYLANGLYSYAISIVAGEIAFLERAEYPTTRVLVSRPHRP